jgi:putative acetyltransferase
MIYPDVMNPELVGTYEPLAEIGGGYVWDEVLEYRVWCHPEQGASDIAGGSDYYYPFKSCEEALAFSEATDGAEEPLALILQREYISEPEPGVYIHMKEERITEWPVEFLRRPRRRPQTIPDFLASDAPTNRLDILRELT